MWSAKHHEEIEIFHLPSCSPKLNPDEHPNCDLKVDVHSAEPAHRKERLKKRVIPHMRMLKN